MMWVWLIGITFLFGPMVGATYALAEGASTLETAAFISMIHVVLVPVWFGIFYFLKYPLRYYKRTVRKLVGKTVISKKLHSAVQSGIQEFEKFRGWNLGTAVFGFTFLFGVSWSALLAYLLNLRMRTIFLSVAAGAVASAVFWTVALSSVGEFLPESWMIYLVVGVMTFATLTYAKYHEKKLVREMSRSLRKLDIQMVRRLKTKTKKRA